MVTPWDTPRSMRGCTLGLGVLVVAMNSVPAWLGWTSWSMGLSGSTSLRLAQSPWLEEGRLEEDLTWKNRIRIIRKRS